MDRIKLTFPSFRFPFSVPLLVRVTDLNYANHVGNHAFLAYIHEARIQFLAVMGYSEFTIETIGLIMADAAIVYKAELLYGDILTIEVASGPINKAGFDVWYRITAERNSTTFLACLAKTSMVGFDYATRKKASLPEKAILTLKEWQPKPTD